MWRALCSGVAGEHTVDWSSLKGKNSSTEKTKSETIELGGSVEVEAAPVKVGASLKKTWEEAEKVTNSQCSEIEKTG